MRNIKKNGRGSAIAIVASLATSYVAPELGIDPTSVEGIALTGAAFSAIEGAYRVLRKRWGWLAEFDPVIVGGEDGIAAPIEVTLRRADAKPLTVLFDPETRMTIPVEWYVESIELAPKPVGV